MKKFSRSILFSASLLLALIGFILISGWYSAALSAVIAQASARRASANWPGYFQWAGLLALLGAAALAGSAQILRALRALGHGLRLTLARSDRWLDQRVANELELSSVRSLSWPLRFSLPDGLAVLVFAVLALLYQLAMSSQGFPYVILGGDAANIASFAAGRAYPQLFGSDAILGDLRNIGLYTTIHLPLTILLEKLLGNFGLAYSVLLFPHVFFQYFSYYLLGRVLFNQRYWAFLFCLAASAPLMFAGGEVWGAVGDGMPRFTYQVLIPFLLILLLTAWRERPQRWPWVMLCAGLMAFIHPVSTPPWAFALWLGFWPIMPASYDLRRKVREMFRLGLVLAVALLPYVSIYLTYKKGGRGGSDYDLVYFILTNYFPYDLLNIPAAVRTLFNVTAQYGLLWYGLVGLALTFVVFRAERSRIAQMLTWVAGIVFVSILFPFVEQIIERSLRIIPLQTELMRGMRYLAPFLFIFWFYPLALLTSSARRKQLVGTVFALGTVLCLAWLSLNPPYPFMAAPVMLRCWSQGELFCPTESDYTDVLTHIRTETPQNSQFVVFLTRRWSGIEVRYLGMRPMAYAYKDRGQLTFTNLEALQTWFYFLNRENAIYSRNNSPTLELKQERMVDFARDARANYMLTDFPFSPDALARLRVSIAYQNKSYTVLNVYSTR